MAEEKITFNISGYDINEDNEVNITGPVKIYGVYDTIEEANLALSAVENFDNYSGDYIVYIRNVTNFKDQYDYVGAFFRFDPSRKTITDRVILANHTHENPHILDKILEINKEDFELDKTKILTIKRIDPDNFEGTTDYEVQWMDSLDANKVLPEIPSEDNFNGSDTLYLSLSKDGSMTWENNFLPNSIFKKQDIILTKDLISENGKTLTINIVCDSVECPCDPCLCFRYNPTYDTLMVFDNGTLLTDVEITQVEDKISFHVEHDDTFEENDRVTVLLVRNGITGILDTVRDEYLTKREAISIISNGRVDLNKYALKDELSNYAYKIHTHSQYALSGHNHDERYADYHHVHKEYVTEAEITKIIADAIESNPENPDLTVELIKGLIESLNTKIDNLISELGQRYTNEQIDALLDNLRNALFSTDNIIYKKGTSEEANLTDIIDKFVDFALHIEDHLSNVASTDQNITLSEHIVQNPIGMYYEGAIIQEGTTLDAFISNILRNPIPDNKSTFVVEYKDTFNNEIGSTVRVDILPKFTEGDNYSLIEIKCRVITSVGTQELIINNNEEYPLYVTLLPFTYNEKTVGAVIQCIASVNSKTAAVTSMLYSDVFVIEPKRLGFFGSVPNKLDELDRPSSDSIRLVQNNFTLDEYKNYYGQTFKISDLYNIGSIVIAIPISWNNDPEKLIYLQQNTDVLELMSVYKQIPIEGGNKYPTEMYDIYYYRFNEVVNTDMNFILYASERNEKPELAKPGNESKCEQIDSIPSDLLNSIISSILN